MYKTISFDLWSVMVIRQILLLKGLIFPPFLEFRDKWTKEIARLTRTVVPDAEWGCSSNEIDAVVRNKIKKVVEHFAQNFTEASFDKAWFSPFDLHSKMTQDQLGTYEILYFFISLLAKNGYLGNEEEARKFLIEKANTNYATDVHAENVRCLFL